MTPRVHHSQPLAECRWSEPASRPGLTSDDEAVGRYWLCERTNRPVPVTQADCGKCAYWSLESPSATQPRRRRVRTGYGAQKHDSLVQAIREEFAEMPCMRLTRAQFQRLWHLRPTESDRLVDELTALGFLAEDSQGRICRSLQVG